MGLFENFPYTNLHDLNLDWILQEVKKLKEAGGYSPENPPPYPVTSVNGKTGAVILFNEQEGAYVRFPDSDNDQWNIYRLIDGVPAGIQFSATLPAKRMQGANRFAIYDEGNPPPYPVTSVNGKTGAVILFSDHDGAYIQFPDSNLSQWNVYRIIDEQTNGIQFHKDGPAVRMQGDNRYQIYDQGNPPPYPVTSVNGLTGAAETPFTDHTDDVLEFVAGAVGAEWGLKRTINTGSETDEAEVEFTLQLNDSTGAPEAYIASGETVKKLLTEDDIPSSSGVVSVNGLTGVVTLNGSNLPAAPDTTQTIGNAISAEAQARQQADTSLNNNITKLQNGLAYIVGNTNTTGSTLAVGEFVYVKDHSSIAEGLRKVTNSIPANGSITTNNTEACPNGGLNALNSKLTPQRITATAGEHTTIIDQSIYRIGRLVMVNISVRLNAVLAETEAMVLGLPQPDSFVPIMGVGNLGGNGYQAYLSTTGSILNAYDGFNANKVYFFNFAYSTLSDT